jgi:hypothetical protein
MVTIEGIKVNVKHISKSQLTSAWEALTPQPFPKVKAYQLKDDDFNRIITLRRCPEDELRELKEWDTILTTDGTDACVFNVDESAGFDFIIIVRERPYHSLEEIIEHELSHIARGDL